MRILDRYILKQFLKPFLFGLVAFVGIFLITHLFDSVRFIFYRKALLADVGLYLLYLIPSIITQIIPIAVVLGAILCVNQLNKYRELTIMKSSGLNLYRIISPLLIAAFVLSLGAFAFEQAIVYRSQQKANSIKKYKIEKMAEKTTFENISFYEENQFFYIRQYDAPKKAIHHLSIIHRRDDHTIAARLDARRGKWEKEEEAFKWMLNDGVMRYFSPEGEIIKSEPFLEKVLLLAHCPQDFQETKDPQTMNIFALKNYIGQLAGAGYYNPELLVDLYQKISFPLASLSLVVLGIPLALRFSRPGMSMGFGLSALLAFLYWMVMSLGMAWGKNEAIGPFLASFFATFLFSGLGLCFLLRTQK